MESIGELLSSIVADYENISSLSNNELHTKSEEIRQNLKVIIQHHLTDIPQLVKEVGKAKGQTTQTEMVLNFLHYLVSQFPHPVFAPSSAQFQSEDEKEKMEKYKDFISWICASLLRLLAEPDLKKIHAIVLKLLITLLELIKTKNVPVFRYLLSEIIQISSDLNQAYEDLSVPKSSDVSVPTQVNIKFFFGQLHGKDEEEITVLKIKSLKSILALCGLFNALLQALVSDVCQFVDDRLHTVWCIALFQVDNGDFQLKASSFSLLTTLLQHSAMPEHQILHYMMFCLVSSIELSVSLFQGKDESLIEDGTWKQFVTEFCKFMKEIFSLPSNRKQYSLHCKHKINPMHLSTLAHCLSSEMEILRAEEVAADNFDEGYQDFLNSIIQASRYIVSSAMISLTPHSISPIQLNHIHIIFNWILHLIYLKIPDKVKDGIVRFISEALTYEMQHHILFITISGGESQDNQMSDQANEIKMKNLVMLKTFFEDQKNLNEAISKLDMKKCIEKISSLLIILESGAATLIHFKSLPTNNRESVHHKLLKEWYQYLISCLLDREMAVSQMKSNMKCLNSSVLSPDGSELYVSSYGSCVKIVQMYFLILHIVKNDMSEKTCKIRENFSKTLTLPFVSMVSLPWIETLELEDLGSDLSSTGLYKSTLLPISLNLRKAGIDISCVCKLNEDAKNILCDCLKSLAICSAGKYARWRSALLIKWALLESVPISHTSLSILPIFITKCSEIGRSIFNDILSHIERICKKSESRSNHTTLFMACKLLNHLVTLVQGGCVIEAENIENNIYCSSCKQYQSSIASFVLSAKSQSGDESKKQNLSSKYVLDKICSILSLMQPCLSISSECQNDDFLCIKTFKNTFLTLVGNFFQNVEKRKENEMLNELLHQWISDLKIYSGNDLDDVFRNAVDLKHLNSQWNNGIIKHIDSLLKKSQEEKDIKLHAHLIRIIGILARCSLKDNLEFSSSSLFSWSLLHLYVELQSSMVLVQSTTYLELVNLLKCSGKYKWKDLFQLHKHEICMCIATSILEVDCNSGKRPSVEMLEDIAQLFTVPLDDFLRLNMQYILPEIVTSVQREPLLKLFSEITGTSNVDILMQNFKHIFCHAVVRGYDLHLLFSFLETETRIKKESLLLLNFGSLVHHLVSHISLNLDQVHKALNVITDVKSSSAASSSRKVSKVRTKSSLSELIQPHFLGILTFFNCQLRSSSVAVAEKKRILDSLICLLKLMDARDVTSVRVKIINTLCLAQQLYKHRNWLVTCCYAWDTFVRSIEPSSLSPILSQVTVTILPLLEEFPDMVSKILKYLVIENSSQTREHLHELYYLPDHPDLKEVYKLINEEMNKQHQDDLTTHLSQAVHLMTHESSEVRVQALTRLLQTLKEKQEKVQKHHMSNGRDVSDPIMSQIVSTLLVGCRDNNKQLRLLCGKCLGLIGAIDPDRLSLNIPGSSGTVGDFFALDDPNFAFNLISELVKALLAAKPTHQDISAFAIQELLKIYDCKDGTKDTHGRRLWRRFSENVQEVLEPHHTSRYLLKKSEIPLSNLKQPVLLRKANMTFRDWAGSFCAVLMQMVYESSETSTASRVYRSCSAVARNDLNVALFILPHGLLQALLSTEHADFIVQEVLAILEHTEQLKDRTVSSPDNEEKNQKSGTMSDQLPSQDTPTINNMLINSQHARGSHLLQLSAQVIFSALDHTNRWLRQTDEVGSDVRKKTSRADEKSNQLSTIKGFLGRIPQLLLAQASFRCRAYTRALLHYEAHLREQREAQREENMDDVIKQGIDFLQQLFVEMDEPDGVAGIAAVRLGKPTLSVQIKQLESTGALQDACACYERAIQLNPDDLHKRDYVKCLMDLGQLSTAVCVIDGTLAKNASRESDLNSYRVEAAWRLGRWDMLEEYLHPSVSDVATKCHDWNTRLGELLLVIKNNHWMKFQTFVNEIYQDQTGPLSAASMESGSYQRGYESILRLHMLTELESFVESIENKEKNLLGAATRCFASWQERLKPLQTSFKAREPVLALQRTMLKLLSVVPISAKGKSQLSETSVKKMIGKLWLESAKNARHAGYLQTSYNALINAQDLDLPEFCIEHAKLLWHKGESHRALLTLQKGVADHFAEEDSGPSMISLSERMSKAKAMLLVARLMEESSSFDSNTVLKQFREVVVYMNEWEDSHFHAAKYYDKLMTAFMGDNRSSGKANHLFYIMHHYGLSLCYGTSHIYESLTKLLTVWLDYEANVAKLEKSNKQYSKEDAQKLISVITDLRGRLPAYIFLTAFSQLVSRICHQHLPTFEELKQVVAMVICAYPQQALWTMMAISKSSYSQRAQRCKLIFDLAESKGKKLGKLLSDATRLTDKLLELCNKPTNNIQSLSISTHFKPLKRLVEERTFSEILLPLQRFMTVTLPQDDLVSSSAQEPSTSTRGATNTLTTRQHDPFPVASVYIIAFDDTRPKKISIKASDGHSYLFLCKPKDDLRKDARLMEFNAIVNKCLKRDSESRKRQLKIRTYAVVPLNEECGLIEWVPNTHGLRNILLKIYKSRDMYTSGKILKSLQLPYSAPLEKKLDVFKKKLLPRHPPVFGDWLIATFPDPTTWYNARLAYARSTAVMSMVGYILGLGDRHGENILFDSTCGDAVHVDFNCLFNKGMSLDVPEIVPFRLTHNMTDAMGPMKHEGFFRCACEVVMRLLRQQREPLLSVLKTFIYDPLVEWSKRSRDGMANESGEIVNEKALSHVSDIDKRLRGIAAKNKGLPLSVEGHVHYLIQEATDEEKLCQMYIGWAPYM